MTATQRPYFHLIAIGLTFSLAMLLLMAAPTSALLFDNDSPRETKVRNLNLLAAGTVITLGVLTWDYFQRSPRAENEDWFGRNSDDGGSDKLGHLYTTYALSHLYAWIYRDWAYAEERAMRLGAYSALGTMTIMELGDSFSEYGFSYEDMLMNCAGAVAGYLLGIQPEWRQHLDLRLEYVPNLNHFEPDVFTDYEQHKYLLALKADGFDLFSDTPLRYLELHLGYYARGYDGHHSSQSDDDRKRTLYVGLGLNVGKMLEGICKTRLFNYLQLPYTYLSLDHDMD